MPKISAWMSPSGIKYNGSCSIFNTKISIRAYTKVATKQIASFQMPLYLKSVTFKTIIEIDVVKSNACVTIEYKLSKRIYLLLKPTPGQAKKIKEQSNAEIDAKL